MKEKILLSRFSVLKPRLEFKTSLFWINACKYGYL